MISCHSYQQHVDYLIWSKFAIRMQVHFQIEQLPKFKNAVVTIGAFDGVHAGHQTILKSLMNEAKKGGLMQRRLGQEKSHPKVAS